MILQVLNPLQRFSHLVAAADEAPPMKRDMLLQIKQRLRIQQGGHKKSVQVRCSPPVSAHLCACLLLCLCCCCCLCVCANYRKIYYPLSYGIQEDKMTLSYLQTLQTLL